MIRRISARYEIVRLFARLGFAVVAAAVLAALWALAHGGPFRHSLEAGFYAVGALCLLLGAVGGSPSRRDASSAGWMARWAYPDTFAVNRDNPPDRTLGPAVVFGVVGIVMFAVAIAIT